MAAEIEGRIRRFIEESFQLRSGPGTLADDAPLLDALVFDAQGIVETIAFLEGAFGIRVADEEIGVENLGSIRAIAAYVAHKLAVRPAA